MTEEMQARCRGRLQQMKKETERALEAAKENARPPELDQTMVGRLSRMDALQQQQMALANQRRNEAMLRRIDAAIARIDAGDYGFCSGCDEPINEKRLDLDPTVQTCIRCAGGGEGKS